MNQHKIILQVLKYLLNDVNIGPKALARAPKDRNIPVAVPRCSGVPNVDIKVVRHGTTMALAVIR